MTKLTLPEGARWRVLFPLALAALALAALGWGMEAASAAPDGVTVRYVDGATGSDTGDCTSTASPCATVQYALDQSVSGDEIRVAQGTYTETLGVSIAVNLLGGYEAAGWTRDIAANPTIIDAAGADSLVVNITPGADATIEGFTIQGANHVSDVGGGVFINTANVVISGTVIQNNTVGNGGSGGGVWLEGDGVGLSLVNSAILSNTVTGSGGGLAGGGINNNATISLENAEVRGNSAQGEGGAMALNGATVNITASAIVSNTAAGAGGGIRVHGGITLTIMSSDLLSNTTGVGGGAIAADNNILVLDDVTVAGNWAGDTGGGIHVWSQASLTISESRINGNLATGRGGGGLYADGSAVSVSTSQINDNTADGPSDVNGGGVMVENDATLAIDDSVLMGNRAIASNFSAANALVANTSHLTMTHTIVMDNRVGLSAISLYGPTTFDFTNVLVADNDGDGVSSDEGPVSGTFMNVTIADNTAFGVRLTPDVVSIVNSILWGNGMDDNGCGGCTSSYSDIGTGDTAGVGNVSADPLFVDPANQDYHLGVGSPVIDAGIVAGAPAVDLEGTPRQVAPDMGAYEWVGFRNFLPYIIR